MTNTKQQYEGNGDTDSHQRKADEAVARKFYTQVEGKTLEEARVIIKRLIEKGMLNDSAYYNREIARDYKEKERVREREEREATRREEERKKHDEFYAKKERDRAEGKGEPYYLSPENKAVLLDFIAKGCTKSVIAGILKTIGGLNKAQIERAISDLMPTKAKASRVTFNTTLDARLLEGQMSEEGLDAMIGGDVNALKNRAYHLKRVQFANAIHAKYGQ